MREAGGRRQGPLAVAVLGCGDIATGQHLPALARDPRFRVVALADPRPGRAADVGRRFGVGECFLDAEQALALGPDAAIVATPPHVSAGLARRALEAGVHVLCEKPVAVRLADAEALAAAAARSGAVLQVGFKNRFSPLVARLREVVAEGRLGWPLVVRCGSFDERYDPADREHSERIRGFLEHGPPVVHEGAHSADLVLWLLGPALRVQASALRSRADFPAPNYHCAAVEHAGGSLSRLEVGWWFPRILPGELQVYGPEASAELSRPEGRLTIGDGRRDELLRCEEDWQTACFRGQLDAFAEAIDGGPRRGAGAADGLAALALTLAIVEAARTGAAVEPAQAAAA